MLKATSYILVIEDLLFVLTGNTGKLDVWLPNTVSRLPIPYAYRLIVRRTDYPWVLVVKEGGSNVVQMAKQSKQALALLVIPHLDFVVVAARHKKRLLAMKWNASHRTFVKTNRFKIMILFYSCLLIQNQLNLSIYHRVHRIYRS